MRKCIKSPKSLHTGDDMYKFASKQISFEDFNQPLGLKMNPENRWIKKAEFVPWNEIEKEYAKLFQGYNGQVAKPLRMALGALLIQTEYGYSDEEIVEQIREAPYLQFFCGLPGYEDKRPFDPSDMVRFRKRLTPEILGKINEMIIEQKEGPKKPDQPNQGKQEEELPKNQGTMIVDATCAPSQIKYPQDTELLNEAREKLEKMVDEMHDPHEGKKPRMYQRKARKQYLSVARSKRNSARKIRNAIRQQLQYIRRNLRYVHDMLTSGKELSKRQSHQLETIETLYEQQKYMYEKRVHSVKDRIVNLRQEYLRPIVRGKAKTPVEFGAKLDISVVNGLVHLEKQTFDAYNEGELLAEEIENYRQRYGYYPERVLADKIYRNRKNLKYCKERGIRLSGPALGRPAKDAVANKEEKAEEYEDICDRVEVERAFSLAKRKFSLSQIRTYLKETTQSVIALSILALNLNKVWRQQIFQLLWSLFYRCDDAQNMCTMNELVFVQ